MTAPAFGVVHVGERGRRTTGIALVLCLPALLIYAALQIGGYYPEDVVLVGALAFAATAVGLLVGGLRIPGRAALVGLGALAGLAAWTGISAAWSPDPGEARVAMERTLAYTGVVALALVAARDRKLAALALRLVVGGLVAVCVVALLSRLRPDWIATDPIFERYADGRLAYPIMYWNGLGAVAAMGFIGAACLAADAREHVAVRALCAAGATIAGTVLVLTLSRGSGLSLAGGLAVVLAISPYRLRLAVSIAVAIGATGLAVLALRTNMVLINADGPAAERIDPGTTALWLIVAIALGAAGVQALLSRVRVLNRRRSRRRGDQTVTLPTTTPPALWLAPIALVAIVVLVAYAAFDDRLESRAYSGGGGFKSFVDRQYDDFMTPGAPDAGTARLNSVRSSRSEAYRVAIDGFQAHPLAGDGAGGYRIRYMRERKYAEAFRNAHSLELETISELGAVGGLLLVALIGALGSGLTVLRARGRFLSRCQGAAAGGVLVVFLLHSGFDWDWQLAGVTLPALVCGTLLLAAGGRTPKRAEA